MKLLVIVNKLNKRASIPASFLEKESIIGVVMKGYRFDGTEVSNLPNPAMGKWYSDKDGAFYWGGGLLIETERTNEQ